MSRYTSCGLYIDRSRFRWTVTDHHRSDITSHTHTRPLSRESCVVYCRKVKQKKKKMIKKNGKKKIYCK